MKKTFFLFVFGVLVIISIFYFSNFIQKEQSCSLEKLFLSETDYPLSTTFDAINSPIDEKPKESASRASYYYESSMRESVIKYRTIDKAYEIFNYYNSSFFDPNEVYSVWNSPLLKTDLLLASHNNNGCGNVKSFGDRCIFLGQYEEYIIIFDADISQNGITEEIFRDLVLRIDKKTASCVINYSE